MFTTLILSFLTSNLVLLFWYFYHLNLVSLVLISIQKLTFGYQDIALPQIGNIFIHYDLLHISSSSLFGLYFLSDKGIAKMDNSNAYIDLVYDFANTKMNRFALWLLKLFKPHIN